MSATAERKLTHTPGPWKVTAAEFRGKGIVAYEIRMPRPEISAGNCWLIEAAEDLLEALEYVIEMREVKCSHDKPGFDPICARCKADVAIKKATREPRGR